MSTEYQIVLNTCPDQASADKLAAALIDQGIAACVSIVPGIRSLYRWQGQIESSQEHLLLIKTTRSHYNSVQQLICTQHPYELPEVLAVPIEQGLGDYFNWIDSNLSRHNDNN